VCHAATGGNQNGDDNCKVKDFHVRSFGWTEGRSGQAAAVATLKREQEKNPRNARANP
jgi:hypothetical protein